MCNGYIRTSGWTLRRFCKRFKLNNFQNAITNLCTVDQTSKYFSLFIDLVTHEMLI